MYKVESLPSRKQKFKETEDTSVGIRQNFLPCRNSGQTRLAIGMWMKSPWSFKLHACIRSKASCGFWMVASFQVLAVSVQPFVNRQQQQASNVFKKTLSEEVSKLLKLGNALRLWDKTIEGMVVRHLLSAGWWPRMVSVCPSVEWRFTHSLLCSLKPTAHSSALPGWVEL